jgi:hypothetical protein
MLENTGTDCTRSVLFDAALLHTGRLTLISANDTASWLRACLREQRH